MPTEPATAAPAQTAARNRFRNNRRMFEVADPSWQEAADHGLLSIEIDSANGSVLQPHGDAGRELINMCSCSYLGLNSHPAVIAGSIDALTRFGATSLSISPTRIRPRMLTDLEDELARLFGAPAAVVGVSCAALVAGVLPLAASGHLTGGDGPVTMVYDRNSHFCLAYTKPVCADEAEVHTIGHNDMDALEEFCRTRPRVAYVADGAYSMGGAAPFARLAQLQERYGLLLLLDDSHALSALGTNGRGMALSALAPDNPLTMVFASLGKGFGTKGGVLLFGDPALRDRLLRHGGALSWSQNIGAADIGASLASAALHGSDELVALQQRLRANVEHFDQVLPTPYDGDGLMIRRLPFSSAEGAVAASARLLERGYYTSAVYFPIVARDESGLRVMIRADLTHDQISEFAAAVAQAQRDDLAAVR